MNMHYTAQCAGGGVSHSSSFDYSLLTVKSAESEVEKNNSTHQIDKSS